VYRKPKDPICSGFPAEAPAKADLRQKFRFFGGGSPASKKRSSEETVAMAQPAGRRN